MQTLITFYIILLFGAGTSCSFSQSAIASPDRGFGKIAPGYQSFYYVRKQLPFYLVDNQGRNVAEILVYVKALPGKPIQHEVQGTTQYDNDVPLHVVVRNLTQDCAVSIEWLDFEFREDGQASSRGLGTPPGADPNTTVPAAGVYSHVFTYRSVTTFRNGKPVLNEVLPATALQCARNPVGPIASSTSTGNARDKSSALSQLRRVLTPTQDGNDLYTFRVGNDCSLTVSRTLTGGGAGPNQIFQLNTLYRMNELQGRSIFLQQNEESFETTNELQAEIGSKDRLDAIYRAFKEALIACGNTKVVTQ